MIGSVLIANSAETIARCFPIMRELRPHLQPDEFVARVQRQHAQGYDLAFLEAGGEIRVVAGFRVAECLAWGRLLYVDDLVTRPQDQGKGFGAVMFDWLLDQAHARGCEELHLDSGVQRFGAHRFYLHKNLDITCHHFALKLREMKRKPSPAQAPS